MTSQRYSLKEALNRLLRVFKGQTNPTDEPEALDGEILSENQALSELAELVQDSLPGYTFTLPASTSIDPSSVGSATTTTEGVAELATVAEAEAGTDTSRITTPEGVLASINANAPSAVSEYGQIYTATGTVTVAMTTSWAKVTGSFDVNGISTDGVTPDFANDEIVISQIGTYLLGAQYSFSGGGNAIFDLAIYLDGVRQEQLRIQRKLSAGGDVGSASTVGFLSITGTSDIELWAKADGSHNFTLVAGQLTAHRI